MLSFCVTSIWGSVVWLVVTILIGDYAVVVATSWLRIH
jgi:hypothetical protein